ncbi:replication-relaxation family protein [Mollicutes bacterium LVI A0078]|nr:replication-relaxation family protein [Mollicutes bacterium LVI A0075]WOO90573.1 replication-relaxation family protein [Mollicutes bacterium LVI A0078]
MTKRDKQILRHLYNFRFLSTNQLLDLMSLSGNKIELTYMRKRLKELADCEVVDRNRKILYQSYIYNLSDFGYQELNEDVKRHVKFGGRNLIHELFVADTLIYMCKFLSYDFNDYLTEEQLLLDDIEIVEEESVFTSEVIKKMKDNKKHLGDLVFSNETVIEVEISRKRKSRLFTNLEQNKKNYKKQIWVIYEHDKYIENVIKKFDEEIQIIYIETIIRKLGRELFYG